MKAKKFIMPDADKLDELVEVAHSLINPSLDKDDVAVDRTLLFHALTQDWDATEEEFDEFELVIKKGISNSMIISRPF